jgi:hypothetical protein
VGASQASPEVAQDPALSKGHGSILPTEPQPANPQLASILPHFNLSFSHFFSFSFSIILRQGFAVKPRLA